MALSIGQIVYLKSGSLPMTVIKAEDNKHYVLSWSTGNALTTTNLPEEALTELDPRQALSAAEDKRMDEAKLSSVAAEVAKSIK